MKSLVVLQEHSNTCTCPFFVAYQLVCQHIFYAKKVNKEDLFIPDNVPKRWHKQYQQSQATENVDSEHRGNLTVSVCHRPPITALSRNEKFKKLRLLLNSISDSCCEVGSKEFHSRYELLEKIYSAWSNHEECVIMTTQPPMTGHANISQTTSAVCILILC